LQDINTSLRVTNNLGLITYSFVVGQAQYKFNSPPGSIVINDNASADPYPSTIVVSNIPGTVTKVTVTLNNYSHDFPADVDMLLVNPQGKSTVFMSDAGGIFAVSGVNLTFDDNAANVIPQTAGPAGMQSGIYRPTNYVETWYGQETVDFFPTNIANPPPAGPWTNCAMSALIGGNPNGEWKLYIVDDLGYNSGELAGGWSLNLMTSGSGSSSSDLAVTDLSAPTQTFGAGLITYSVTVANNGPSTANYISVTNILDANCTYVGCDIGSAGFITVSNNLVIISLGTLTNGYNKTYHLQVTNNLPSGNVTFKANIANVQNDPSFVNNMRSMTTSIGLPAVTVQWNTGHTALNVAWPANATGYSLEMTDTLRPPNWITVTGYSTSGGQNIATIYTTNSTRFFRLRK
jgi:uncharacterized repeat protein (TIGR01451 family)